MVIKDIHSDMSLVIETVGPTKKKVSGKEESVRLFSPDRRPHKEISCHDIIDNGHHHCQGCQRGNLSRPDGD